MQTQSIKYLGSKLQLIPVILDTIKYLPIRSVLDAFSGSTRVSQAFAQANYKVASNDLSSLSMVLANSFLIYNTNDRFEEFHDLLEEANSLKPIRGWFTENYGGSAFEVVKKPFQNHVTMKLDAIQNFIYSGKVADDQKDVVLTSLILALDKVDNTMGHFSSYVKGWCTRSYKDLVLELPLILENTNGHSVYQSDILKLYTNVKYDLAYLDPPYGSNNDKMPSSRVRYSSYYHFWETVVRNDEPELFGKVGRRADSRDSNSSIFESYSKDYGDVYLAETALRKTIKHVNAKYVFISYGSGGRIPVQNIIEMCKELGSVVYMKSFNHKDNCMTNMTWTNNWVRDVKEPNLEYLFLIEKF